MKRFLFREQDAALGIINRKLVIEAVQDIQGLMERARQGDAESQYLLGGHYAAGVGVKQDRIEAARLWHQAALQNHGKVQVLLALSYYYGAGVPLQSNKLATNWLLQACGQHVPQAHEVLRRMTTRIQFRNKIRTLVRPIYVGPQPAAAEPVAAEPSLPDPSIIDLATIKVSAPLKTALPWADCPPATLAHSGCTP